MTDVSTYTLRFMSFFLFREPVACPLLLMSFLELHRSTKPDRTRRLNVVDELYRNKSMLAPLISFNFWPL